MRTELKSGSRSRSSRGPKHWPRLRLRAARPAGKQVGAGMGRGAMVEMAVVFVVNAKAGMRWRRKRGLNVLVR